jgi:C-terminal processing protease CtpA/Prc
LCCYTKWLLIDEKVFSASEGFAALCKEMKLAIIIGKTSRGDGSGVDPALIMLPNSKMVLRYTLDYSTNP